ncbi:MAG: hypothetical protein IPI60_14850 [Saprospiraceae bacterium]|nr:hypothetical protein [Saprospiraceae bacterium]
MQIENAKSEILIVNSHGKMMKRFVPGDQEKNNYTIELSGLLPGIYWLKTKGLSKSFVKK